MITTLNPYTAPRSPSPAVEPSPDDAGTVTPDVLRSMRATRPWILFLGILGSLASGMMGVVGLLFVRDRPFGTWLDLVYLLLPLAYLVPSLLLLRYADGIKQLLVSEDVVMLELALRRQKSFWRLVGILTAMMLGIQVLGLVTALVTFLR